MTITPTQLEAALSAAYAQAFAVANAEIAAQFGDAYEDYRKASMVTRYALEEFEDSLTESLETL